MKTIYATNMKENASIPLETRTTIKRMLNTTVKCADKSTQTSYNSRSMCSFNTTTSRFTLNMEGALTIASALAI